MPVSEANAPVLTTQLVSWFKEHDIIATGVEFGEGMQPFSVICKGHPSAKEAKQRLEDATRVEAGNSVSLSDARAISTSDARLPTMVYHVVDKLNGFSVILDCYFGAHHTLAYSVRQGAALLGPSILALMGYYPSPVEALRMATRVLFQVQQMSFRWLRVRRALQDTSRAVPAPDFLGLAQDVSSFLTGGVPQLPHAWEALVTDAIGDQRPGAARICGGGGGGATTPSSKGRGRNRAISNGAQDDEVKQRWINTGYERTSQMTRNWRGTGDHREHIPKHDNGNPACLNWECKGTCSTLCARHTEHVPTGAAMTRKIHDFMDKCGVARA